MINADKLRQMIRELECEERGRGSYGTPSQAILFLTC